MDSLGFNSSVKDDDDDDDGGLVLVAAVDITNG